MNKPIEDFKTRFNKALSIRDIRPADLAAKSGLSKSTISHYMSGYTKPKSDKLFILAKALSVNEAWLMGLDVPMEKTVYENADIDLTNTDISTQILFVLTQLIDEGTATIEDTQTGRRTTLFAEDIVRRIYHGANELLLLDMYHVLNAAGQSKALEQIKLLAKIPEYRKDNIIQQPSDKTYLEPIAAHERTDTEVTNEMRKHDDDLMDNDDLWK